MYLGAMSLPEPATRLIGREKDAATAREILALTDVRLLSLVGPAGIGKTRLAIEVASQLEAGFSEGAYFVDLSSIEDAGRFFGALAAGAGNSRGPG
jgi:predicted ATPase